MLKSLLLQGVKGG